jgi:radial spoke head protein 4A
MAFIPDLKSDMKVYEWAGISFGEYDVMLLQKNLQKHAAASGASQMRLWGKINGTVKDYFIAESVLDVVEGEETIEGQEPRGSGINKFVYWVTNSPMGEWTQLPDLSPADIIKAR